LDTSHTSTTAHAVRGGATKAFAVFAENKILEMMMSIAPTQKEGFNVISDFLIKTYTK
jgi:tripartite-type tricarboxylate transporter receptor subunit TctC